MADSKITALAALTTADPANDMFPVVDVSDTSMAASGTTKRISINNILACSPSATLASATITGDLTVDTNTLKVDSANNRVGVNTASPANQLSVRNEGASAIAIIDVRGGIGGAGALQISGNGTTLGTTSFNFIQNGAGAFINNQDATPLAVFVNGSERYAISSSGIATWSNVGGVAGTAMTLNSTGLGIGVTPSAWNSSYRGLQLGAGGAISAHTSASLPWLVATSNSFINSVGDWKFINNGYSTRYLARGDDGTQSWWTSNNGSAGGTVSYTQAMTLDASGNLLVGKTASSTTVVGSQVQPDGTFSAVKGDTNPAFFYNRSTAASGTIALFRSNGVTVGTITQDGTNTAYVTSSDYRLKEAVQPLVGGLARVSALKPSIYKWKSNGSSGEGFIAHELAEVVPAAVTGEKDAVNEDGTVNPQGVDLSKVVPILVAAIQELTTRVQTLEAR